MKLSIVIIAFDMPREAPRTIQSLSVPYQVGVRESDYEIILIDHGSTRPVLDSEIQRFPTNLHYRRLESAPPSPVAAIADAVASARGEVVGIWFDGARMATPGIIKAALQAISVDESAVVSTLSWHLGDAPQYESVLQGYDQAEEDALLESIGWPANGYRLFDVSCFAGSSQGGYFAPAAESNALFMRRATFDMIGGLDGRFDLPGGGFANLDLYERAVSHPRTRLVLLLGEGSFHQFHGGITTGGEIERRGGRLAAFAAQYEELRGRPFAPPTDEPIFFGSVPEGAKRFLEISLGPTPRRVGAAGVVTPQDVVIPVLVCIDAEPDPFGFSPFEAAPWSGFEGCAARFDDLRRELAHTVGDPNFCWFIRADPQVAAVHGRADWALRAYRGLIDDLERKGDAIGTHAHAQRWTTNNGGGWEGVHDDPEWVAECVTTAFRSYRSARRKAPVFFRFGNRFMSNQIAALAHALGARYDLTLEPGAPGRTGGGDQSWNGFVEDYGRCPRVPYVPSHADYLRPDARCDGIRFIPISAGPLGPSARATHGPRHALRPGEAPGEGNDACMTLGLWREPAVFRQLVHEVLRSLDRPYLAVVMRSDMAGDPNVHTNLRFLTTHPRSRRFAFCRPDTAMQLLGYERAPGGVQQLRSWALEKTRRAIVQGESLVRDRRW